MGDPQHEPPVARRRADIQGLRALAVVLVVLFHSETTAPGGYVGVDVFFVISGFVITRLLWRELGTTGSISLRSFYTRRAKRLLPALALALTFVAVGASVLQSPLGTQQDAAPVGMAASLFSANVALFLHGQGGYFALPSNSQPLLHTWTLAVEEQFYLFFPLLLLGAWRLAARRDRSTHRAVAVAVVAVTVVSFALGYELTFLRGSLAQKLALSTLAFFSSPTRAWEFAVGGGLALAETALARLDRRLAQMAGLAGLGLVLWASWSFDGTTPFPGTAALVPVLGAALLVISGTPTQKGVPTLLRLRPVVWIGDVSYGWYLWHWPFIVFTRSLWPTAGPPALLSAALLALLPTWLSYRFLENPIRENRGMVGRRVVTLAAACCAAPVLLFTALLASAHYPTGRVAELQHQVAAHVDQTHHCLDNLPWDANTATVCTWRVARAKGTIYLIGDSNAGHFAEPLIAAARRERYDVTLATYGGCQIGTLLTRIPGYDTKACQWFAFNWVQHLARTKPSLVMLANESIGAIQSSVVSFELPRSGEVARTPEAKAQVLTKGLASTLRTLTGSGTHVAVLQTVPQYQSFDLRTCPAVRIYLDESGCGPTQTRARADDAARLAHDAVQAAVDRVPDATAVDFTDLLCSPAECSTHRDGHWLYRDGAHLSIGGSMLLTDRIQELIRRSAEPSSG